MVDALFSCNVSGYPLQGLAEEAAGLFAARYGAVTLIDCDRQWIVATAGMPIGSTSRAASFCSHTILFDQILIVPDTHADQRFSGSSLVRGPAQIRAYVGCRIVVAGAAVGAVCAFHDNLLPTIHDEALVGLRALADRAAKNLASELKLTSLEAAA